MYSVIDNYERVSYLKERLNKGTERYLKDRAGDRRMHRAKSYDELFEGDIYYITLIEPVMKPDELDRYFTERTAFQETISPIHTIPTNTGMKSTVRTFPRLMRR